MNNNKDIYDTGHPKQMSPFGEESEIDFIEEDEASYYAMAEDMRGVE